MRFTPQAMHDMIKQSQEEELEERKREAAASGPYMV